MLGGMLRALLAMCFSNVVFPLLNKQTKHKRGTTYNIKDPLLNTYP